MENNDFTSGPIRTLSAEELGTSAFTDFELLSDSGHNLVYRAMMDGKWVVLKAAKKDEGAATRNQLLLRREYDIMREADSIYVVRMWQMVDLPDLGPAIVMEYVHGRTLAQFIEENPAASLRRQVANELLEALLSLHDRQIIHGDLKSSNILITENGNHVRLIDFGFADTDAYIAKNIGSSPSIQSPDMPMPESTQTADVQRDIYAFGKVLELLFPHRYGTIRRKCLMHRYISAREIQKEIRKYLLWTRIVLVGCVVLSMIAVLLLWSRPSNSLEDAEWNNLESQANQQYAALYSVYQDSILSLSNRNGREAVQLASNYADRMFKVRQQLINSYPHYEDQLVNHFLIVYTRDCNKLIELRK